MSNKSLLDQISVWHAKNQHVEICQTILALPDQEQTDEIVSLLARALINMDDYKTAIEALDYIKGSYRENPYVCLRYGIALYGLNREHEALDWFYKAQKKGLEDINETPETYKPKSVSKWITFAERRAPQRIEQNIFEAARREQRNKNPQASGFADFDFEGFWDDCEYSLENYIGDKPKDTDITEIEEFLGYRLPDSYKALIKLHNGGLIKRNNFKNPIQCDWMPHVFCINGILGIDPDKPYSLCGDYGNDFWIKDWNYPNIGVAICSCEHSDHEMIFLDYSDCGPDGEPCVVHIAQESDSDITYLADSFEAFIRELFEA